MMRKSYKQREDADIRECDYIPLQQRKWSIKPWPVTFFWMFDD